MSVAKGRVRRIKVKRKPVRVSTRTNTVTRDGEKRKYKTTKLRDSKGRVRASKSTNTKVGEAKRGDIIKRVVTSSKPLNKKEKTKITMVRQGKKGRIVKRIRKSKGMEYPQPTSVKNMPKKKIDRLKEAYRKVMRKKKKK